VRPPASPVDEFGSESGDAAATALSSPSGGETFKLAVPGARPPAPAHVKRVSAVLVAVLVGALVWTLGVPAWRARSSARLAIESTPSGALVLIDGRERGTTPLDLELPAGAAHVLVRSGALERSLSLQLNGGDIVRQMVELQAAAGAGGGSSGTLEVTSEPSRVPLQVDGIAVGTTPLPVTTLAAGDHVLSARFPGGLVQRRLRVEAGRATTLHVVGPAAGVSRDSIVGWLNVATAVPMRISEGGRLLGTTDVNRVMLPIGTHTLRFVNDDTGFEVERTVTVTAGQPTAVQIEVPTSTLSINARPWAEVFVDGERVGETPIGNLNRAIGRHEIVLRHPELGERRQTVLLTPQSPSRVSVDFRSQAR
jgi:hypothetical protein